jgi:hypothetical protein
MKVIYAKDSYEAIAWPSGACSVHRTVELPNGQQLKTHVGERWPHQRWSAQQLFGCSDDVKREIALALKEHLEHK